MNKKNPLVIFAGLGLAGIVALLGVTKDRWMPGEPQATTATSATTGEQAAPAAGDTDASAAKTTTAVEEAPEQTPAPAENTVTAGATGETTGGETAAGQPAASGETAAAGQEQATTAVASSGEQGTQAQPSEAAATTTDTGQQQASTETGQASSASEQPAEKIVPTFDTVRVEKSGEAVIAGRAEPGSDVAVKLNGETVGSTKADSEGAFVVVPQEPLAAGGGSLTIESTSPSGGEAVHSEQTVAVVVPEKKEGEAVVAVVSPEEPTQVLQAPAAEETAEPVAEEAAGNQTVATKTEEATTGDAAPQPAETAPVVQVSLDAVDYDPDGNIVFSGRAAAGSTVRLYVDNAAVGDAVAGSDGKWSFGASSQIASGNHKLRVDQLAADGKVLGRVELPFFREDATKVAQQSGSDTTTPATGQETTTAAATTTETGQTAQTVGEGETQAAAAPQPEIKEGRIVIQPGNNLWTISQVIYGRGVKYTVIYQANQEQIRDPDLIYPGQVFRTPDVMPPESIDPTRRDPLTAEEGGTVGQ